MNTKEFLNYLKQNCSPQIKTMRNKFQAQKLLFLLDNDFANGNESLLKKKSVHCTMNIKRPQFLGVEIFKTPQIMNLVFIEEVFHSTTWLTDRTHNIQVNT